MKYVIEQFGRVYKWHLIEYKHISNIVGKKNLIFTNVKNKADELLKLGAVKKESVSMLNLDNVCILDPEAEKTLTPTDCKRIKYLVFGGILGDYPPRNRTNILSRRLPNALKRNLGKGQFPTDNAVYVAKQVVHGKRLSELKFKEDLLKAGAKEAEIFEYKGHLFGIGRK